MSNFTPWIPRLSFFGALCLRSRKFTEPVLKWFSDGRNANQGGRGGKRRDWRKKRGSYKSDTIRYTYPEKAYNILAHNNNIPAHNKTLLRDCLFITFDSTDNSHVKCLVCLFVILSTVKFPYLTPCWFVVCLGSACLELLMQRGYSEHCEHV